MKTRPALSPLRRNATQPRQPRPRLNSTTVRRSLYLRSITLAVGILSTPVLGRL